MATAIALIALVLAIIAQVQAGAALHNVRRLHRELPWGTLKSDNPDAWESATGGEDE